MMKRSFNGVTIECVQGDIADQPGIEAVVNAANAELRTGGGVAGAIHRAAGPGLEAECRPLAPIKPGQAVITGAHDLPNQHVIHCLGPVYGRDEPSDKLLESCYSSAIRLSEARRLESIAFPAISSGAFGYPSAEAALVALRTVIDETAGLSSLTLVRFVLFSDSDLEIHENTLADLAETADDE